VFVGTPCYTPQSKLGYEVHIPSGHRFHVGADVGRVGSLLDVAAASADEQVVQAIPTNDLVEVVVLPKVGSIGSQLQIP